MRDEIDEDDLPTELWKERNHVDERRKAFIKYFIESDSEDEEVIPKPSDARLESNDLLCSEEDHN